MDVARAVSITCPFSLSPSDDLSTSSDSSSIAEMVFRSDGVSTSFGFDELWAILLFRQLLETLCTDEDMGTAIFASGVRGGV
jgi:hypothetical protein